MSMNNFIIGFFRKFFYVNKKDKVDVSNIITSINSSGKLHKKLIVKIHPDKFMDENLKLIAEEFTKKINENRSNYNELLAIEVEIKEKLNI